MPAVVLAVLLVSAAAVASAEHGDALHKSILFFEGQRFGRWT